MRLSVLAMMSVAGLLSFSILEARPAHAQAQPPVLGPPAAGKVQRISLTDGTQLVGKIVSVTDSTVVFESNLGTTTILRSMISRVREETPGTVRNGVYYFPNPNTTRLFFTPTGRMLEKGEGYFADHWIFFPSVNFGISNTFTLGGGMTLFPGIGLAEQLWYVTPKVGLVQGPEFNFAVGALAASIPYIFDEGALTAGIVYGVGTWGKPDASFTAGLGYGFVNGDFAKNPIIVLGGETRAAPRLSFVTENYVFPGGDLLWSVGLRLFGQGVSLDLAAVGAAGSGGDSGGCCFPFFGAMWKW